MEDFKLIEQQIQPEQQMIQQSIEKQMGNLLVQICIKDAMIARLQQEVAILRATPEMAVRNPDKK